MTSWPVNTLFIDARVADGALARRLQQALPGVPVEYLSDEMAIKARLGHLSLAQGKKALLVTTRQGESVKPCPATSHPYLCCQYTVINQGWQCPMDCSYCVLQGYLEWPVMTCFDDMDESQRQIESLMNREPHRFFRFGTGELADSLALDPLTAQGAEWARFFDRRKNGIIELKTKSTHIEGVLSAPPSHTVLAWSVNPQEVIDRQEFRAAPLEKRLEAAVRAQDAGFMLAFHFDPMIHFPGWEAAYTRTVEAILASVDTRRIAWISLGALRYPPEFETVMAKRFPQSSLRLGEMIKGQDGKMRVIRPLREALFRLVVDRFRQADKDLFLYFCMESPWIWERVMGWVPEDNGHLDFAFAQSLHHRFPHLKMTLPAREHYRVIKASPDA